MARAHLWALTILKWPSLDHIIVILINSTCDRLGYAISTILAPVCICTILCSFYISDVGLLNSRLRNNMPFTKFKVTKQHAFHHSTLEDNQIRCLMMRVYMLSNCGLFQTETYIIGLHMSIFNYLISLGLILMPHCIPFIGS